MAVLPPVAADPYTYPWDGNWTPQNTALIIIDMQVRQRTPAVLQSQSIMHEGS